MEGNVWLDGKGKPIPLDQPLVNQVDSISPTEFWNSRCTRKSIHPKDTPPRKGGAYNSTTVGTDTPHFNTPLSPIMETSINMPQSDMLTSGNKVVQDLRADPKIPTNLLQAAIKNVRSGNNVMQPAQATTTSSSLPFDHQGSVIDSSGNDLSQSNNSSNDESQHTPTTLELKRLKTELEERCRIDTECIKQNFSMQHHRDLQIVRDEDQRRPDDVLHEDRVSKETAIAQSRKIESLQSQMDQLSLLIRQQQETPKNIATTQHNMPHQHNVSLPPPPHTQPYTPTHMQVMFNQSINNAFLDKFEQSMAHWDNVLMNP